MTHDPTEETLAEINRNLERIADHVQLEYELRIKAHRTAPGPEVHEAAQANLLEALGLVRLVLDTGGPGLPGSPNAARLFEAEHLLSRELGNPIWEGGPK